MFEVSLDEGSISSPISTSKAISKGYQRLSKGPNGIDEHTFGTELDEYRFTSDEDGDMPSKMPSSLSVQTTTEIGLGLHAVTVHYGGTARFVRAP